MLPILFEIGTVKVFSYGLLLAIGSAVGIWRAALVSHRAGLRPEQVLDAGMLMVFSGLIGARLTFVLLHYPDYAGNPLSVLAIWDGGLTFFGGLATGALAAYLWSRRNRVNVPAFADVIAPSLALSYGIARIGCFLNGCCNGAQCSLPWAVQFHESGSHLMTPPSHPVQLYSMAVSLLVFGMLVILEKRNLQPGRLFGSWLVLSSIERYVMEEFRKGATANLLVGQLTEAQFVTIFLLGLGLYLIFRKPAQNPKHV